MRILLRPPPRAVQQIEVHGVPLSFSESKSSFSFLRGTALRVRYFPAW